MKIILFIDSLCAGGAQRQLVGLAKLLKDQNHSITILTYHKKDFYLKYVVDNGIDYHYISKAEDKRVRIFYVVKYLWKNKPDVLISYLSTPNIIACLSKLLIRKMKLIVSERNTSQLIDINERIRFFLYRFADKIVPNSYTQEKFIVKNFPSLKNKTVTITNFVDTDYFMPLSRKNRNNCPLIVSVGRITPQKNIINYLKSLRILVDKGLKFKVIWYGNTDRENYYNDCKSLIEELELKDYFEFRPATKQIREEYHKADLFCLPSIFEGFPNVLCEAMSCGLPVLCSNVCDNSNIAEHRKSGLLFDPNNIEDMVAAIENMLEMTGENRQLMSHFNRVRAIEMFSKKSFLEKYMKILIVD